MPKFFSRHQNTGLVASGVSLTLWGEGTSLALVGQTSSDGDTIKITNAGVYSTTNWAPFTSRQNSILNWVLKLNALKQKIKRVTKTV